MQKKIAFTYRKLFKKSVGAVHNRTLEGITCEPKHLIFMETSLMEDNS